MTRASWSLLLCLWLGGRSDAAEATSSANRDDTRAWNAAAAAVYLDGRATWWVNWTKSQRDHETSCISCHTALPYLLSRSVLKNNLPEETSPHAAGPDAQQCPEARHSLEGRAAVLSGCEVRTWKIQGVEVNRVGSERADSGK